jgi:ankyrin repeat protein
MLNEIPRLHRRVIALDVQGVRQLLEEKADVDICDSEKATALHKIMWACDNHKNRGKVVEMVELLLEAHADLYNRLYYRQFTVLHTAAMYNNQEVIPLLIKHGAANCLMIADSYGCIPINLPLISYETQGLLSMYMERVGLPPCWGTTREVGSNREEIN